MSPRAPTSRQALSLVGKRGRVVMTAMAHPDEKQVNLSLVDLTLFEKQVRGSLFGSSNPRVDIFKMLDLYDTGQLMLDELITREYDCPTSTPGTTTAQRP